MSIKHGPRDVRWASARFIRPHSKNNVSRVVLDLRTLLYAIDPRGGAEFDFVTNGGQSFKRRQWKSGEIETFRTKFKRMVEKIYNGQLVLVPPPDLKARHPSIFADLVYQGSARPPRISCELNIILTTDLSLSRIAFSVVNIVPATAYEEAVGSGYRSNVHNDGDNAYQDKSNKLMGDLANEDVVNFPGISRHGGELHQIPQVAAAHEVAHVLGLDHVNAANCGPNKNADDCYGANLNQAMRLTGAGNTLTAVEAGPWIEAMNAFTGPRISWTAERSATAFLDTESKVLH